jgi:hypothetical protein
LDESGKRVTHLNEREIKKFLIPLEGNKQGLIMPFLKRFYAINQSLVVSDSTAEAPADSKWYSTQVEYFKDLAPLLKDLTPDVYFSLGKLFFDLFKRRQSIPSFNEFVNEVELQGLLNSFIPQGVLDDFRNKVRGFVGMLPKTFLILQNLRNQFAFFESEGEAKRYLKAKNMRAILFYFKQAKEKYNYVCGKADISLLGKNKIKPQFKVAKSTLDVRQLYSIYDKSPQTFNYAPNLLKKLSAFWTKAFSKGVDAFSDEINTPPEQEEGMTSGEAQEPAFAEKKKIINVGDRIQSADFDEAVKIMEKNPGIEEVELRTDSGKVKTVKRKGNDYAMSNLNQSMNVGIWRKKINTGENEGKYLCRIVDEDENVLVDNFIGTKEEVDKIILDYKSKGYVDVSQPDFKINQSIKEVILDKDYATNEDYTAVMDMLDNDPSIEKVKLITKNKTTFVTRDKIYDGENVLESKILSGYDMANFAGKDFTSFDKDLVQVEYALTLQGEEKYIFEFNDESLFIWLPKTTGAFYGPGVTVGKEGVARKYARMFEELESGEQWSLCFQYAHYPASDEAADRMRAKEEAWGLSDKNPLLESRIQENAVEFSIEELEEKLQNIYPDDDIFVDEDSKSILISIVDDHSSDEEKETNYRVPKNTKSVDEIVTYITSLNQKKWSHLNQAYAGIKQVGEVIPYKNRYGTVELEIMTESYPVSAIRSTMVPEEYMIDIDTAEAVALITENRHLQMSSKDLRKYYILFHNNASSVQIVRIKSLSLIEGVNPRQEIATLNRGRNPLLQKKWSQNVKEKVKEGEGFFTDHTAEEIAAKSKRDHKGDTGKAIQALEFAINRAGKNWDGTLKSKVKHAISLLQK